MTLGETNEFASWQLSLAFDNDKICISILKNFLKNSLASFKNIKVALTSACYARFAYQQSPVVYLMFSACKVHCIMVFPKTRSISQN